VAEPRTPTMERRARAAEVEVAGAAGAEEEAAKAEAVAQAAAVEPAGAAAVAGAAAGAKPVAEAAATANCAEAAPGVAAKAAARQRGCQSIALMRPVVNRRTRCRPPSAGTVNSVQEFGRKMSSCRTKATVEPSGEKVSPTTWLSRSATGAAAIRRSPVPSARIVKTSGPRAKAIRAPSGDHDGSLPSARRRSPPPIRRRVLARALDEWTARHASWPRSSSAWRIATRARRSRA